MEAVLTPSKSEASELEGGGDNSRCRDGQLGGSTRRRHKLAACDGRVGQWLATDDLVNGGRTIERTRV